MYKFENDKLNHLKDMYGDELDLSNGYKDNHNTIPLSLLKAYQSNPMIEDIIKDIQECFVTNDTFFERKLGKKVACKFCHTDKFMLRYGDYEILATCPNCLWETSAYSG